MWWKPGRELAKGAAMPQASFPDGYLDGWQSVAGDAIAPPSPEHIPSLGKTDYQAGFEYGRAEALEWIDPDFHGRGDLQA
jgi:hypothetical protein